MHWYFTYLWSFLCDYNTLNKALFPYNITLCIFFCFNFWPMVVNWGAMGYITGVTKGEGRGVGDTFTYSMSIGEWQGPGGRRVKCFMTCLEMKGHVALVSLSINLGHWARRLRSFKFFGSWHLLDFIYELLSLSCLTGMFGAHMCGLITAGVLLHVCS